MNQIRSFTVVVMNLVWDLWVGTARKGEFYDSHTVTRTRAGYFLFIALAGATALSLVSWAYLRLK
ncbi:hypothetical protein [Paenibacillus terrigena]|uniref:hypothetical protein n=1 Tax=Paenibacillus terrigena TaxID=369333 RepID=UPI000374A94F|nr:hypothetical protein [Paenibacillus terrigena]